MPGMTAYALLNNLIGRSKGGKKRPACVRNGRRPERRADSRTLFCGSHGCSRPLHACFSFIGIWFKDLLHNPGMPSVSGARVRSGGLVDRRPNPLCGDGFLPPLGNPSFFRPFPTCLRTAGPVRSPAYFLKGNIFLPVWLKIGRMGSVPRDEPHHSTSIPNCKWVESSSRSCCGASRPWWRLSCCW